MSTTVTTIEGAITQLLNADDGVAAIVDGRIQPMSDDDLAALPRLTIMRWGTDRSTATGGFTNDGPTGKANAKLFIDAWSVDPLGAKQLAAAVRRAMNGYSGSVGGFLIACAYINDERETPGALVAGTTNPVQRITLDVRVIFTDQ